MRANGCSIAAATLALTAALAPASAPAATNYVAFGGSAFTFRPSNITIQYGDTVIWTNAGGLHTVTGLSPAEPLCGGSTVSICTHTFNLAGDYLYHCNLHAGLNMTGRVRVLPPAAVPAVLANAFFSNGLFQFTVKSVAQRTNVIQVSTNLGSSNWIAIATLVPATNIFTFTDTNGSALPLRLYRVVEP